MLSAYSGVGSAPEGDLNGDYSVDLLDAILLFRYTMLPDMYPVDYDGNMDYVKDGEINIVDAIYLFRHSMMPDIYPLE